MSTPPGAELAAALGACRGALLATFLFSGAINVLMLTGALFMLGIYDRVLPSHSMPTLLALALLAVLLFSVQGVLELIRSRILVRIAAALDLAVSGRVFDALVRLPLRAGPKADAQAPLRDLDHLRGFLSGGGPVAFFDLPWMPVYLFVIYLFHPVLGVAATIGAAVLALIAALAEWRTRAPSRDAAEAGIARALLAEAGRRNAEVVAAMGMGPRLHANWKQANDRHLAGHRAASDVAGGFGALSRTLRFMLQSGMLGLGAWLVIQGQATAGIIIVGSILVGRALAPVDAAIAHAKSFNAARQGWARLSRLLAAMPAAPAPTRLPAPSRSLRAEAVSVAAPGGTALLVADATFAIQAGQMVGIIGPSGSGKSCLARALAGAWPTLRGRISLDGAALDQYAPDDLGRHIGYLPQDVELFDGTVAQNIARFAPDATDPAIVAAAKAAGAHDLVTALPAGYDTRIGEHGAALSGGQRQRIALARALYGDPFLVVLDEPNSNLDGEGEAALSEAIRGVKARGGIVAIVTHRTAALAGADLLVAMKNGRAQPVAPAKPAAPRPAREPSEAFLRAMDAPLEEALANRPTVNVRDPARLRVVSPAQEDAESGKETTA